MEKYQANDDTSSGQGGPFLRLMTSVARRINYLRLFFRVVGIVLLFCGYLTLAQTAEMTHSELVNQVYLGLFQTLGGGALIIVSMLLK